MAKARAGHVYVELDVNSVVVLHVFTATERPEWDDSLKVLDITGHPRPHVGMIWDGRRFRDGRVRPLPPDPAELDNVRKETIALALLIRQYANAISAGTYTQKSLAELKADFKTIYRGMP